MNSSIPSGEETEKKAQSVDAQAKAQSGTSCSFCWFVLAVYPSLKGMTEKDNATFREHLKKAHGLSEGIPS
jgi:hypothetical protein